jgi:hypothetical protein
MVEGDLNRQRRAPVLLMVCAAAGLGVLALAQFGVISQLYLFGVDREGWVAYVQAAVLVLALVAWHLAPRSWGVLMTLGVLCAVPAHVLLLWPKAFGEWVRVPYLAINAAAAPLLLVGLLGAATAVWRVGRHSAGAVLFGVTLLVSPIANLVMPTAMRDFDGTELSVTGLVVAGVAVMVTIAAAVTAPRPVEPEPGPTWQVTVAGAVAGATPAMYVLWPPPDPNVTRDLTGYLTYFLIVGLVLLGVGLFAGVLAGLRVLVAGAAAGLLLGAVSALDTGVATHIRLWEMGGELAAAAGVVVLVAGAAVAWPRARAVLGIAGLGVVILGLAVLWLMFSSEMPFSAVGPVRVVMATLMGVAIISAVAVSSFLGTVVAEAGEAPATFAGVAAAITGGAGMISVYLLYNQAAGESVYRQWFPDNLYPSAFVFLVGAAVLTVVAHWMGRRTPPRTTDPEPVAQEPVAS